MAGEIRVTNLVKSFGSTTAVNGVSFQVEEGEFVSLLGPSGCGKTTTLRCIGGYESPTSGTIEIAGEVINDRPIYQRNIGMVFQNYALFPHKTVADNVGFPLKMRGAPRGARAERVIRALELVDMAGFEGRYPPQLSAGQRQRVAIARALIFEPSVLLLDEPLANLDRKLRQSMRVEIKLIQERVGISALFVTHDQEEALVMSDRIAIMHGGDIHQIGKPAEVYNHPATAFVATFIGETNFLRGSVLSIEGGVARVRAEGGAELLAETAGECAPGDEVGLSIRPERIHIAASVDNPRPNLMRGVVEFVTYLGASAAYRLKLDEGGDRLEVLQPLGGETAPFQEGDRACVWWEPDRARIVG